MQGHRGEGRQQRVKHTCNTEGYRTYTKSDVVFCMAVQDCLLLLNRQCLTRVQDDAHECLLHAHLSSELVHAVAQQCKSCVCRCK